MVVTSCSSTALLCLLPTHSRGEGAEITSPMLCLFSRLTHPVWLFGANWYVDMYCPGHVLLLNPNTITHPSRWRHLWTFPKTITPLPTVTQRPCIACTRAVIYSLPDQPYNTQEASFTLYVPSSKPYATPPTTAAMINENHKKNRRPQIRFFSVVINLMLNR